MARGTWSLPTAALRSAPKRCLLHFPPSRDEDEIQKFDEQTDGDDDFGLFSIACRPSRERAEDIFKNSTNELLESMISLCIQQLTGTSSGRTFVRGGGARS
jgi:hypothetical protein